MSRPLISVVMATYQGDDMGHLVSAVNSILNQTYTNIEFIIIIDGPIDELKNIFFLEISQLHFVKIYRNIVNRGPAFSRNLGIHKAAGEYIAIMDADDISLPDRLTHQLEYIILKNVDLISSYLTVIHERESIVGIRKVPLEHCAIKKIAPFRCPLHNPSAFGKSSVFKKYKYNNSFRVSEDYDLWVRLLIDGYKLGNTEYPCVHYRQSPSAIRKRIGVKYAVSDFIIKYRATALYPLYLRPLIIIVAFLASLARLMPVKVFKILYKYRTQKK